MNLPTAQLTPFSLYFNPLNFLIPQFTKFHAEFPDFSSLSETRTVQMYTARCAIYAVLNHRLIFKVEMFGSNK